MSILVDTNLLVAATIEEHVHHEPCVNWIASALARTELLVSTHTLAELYAQLTRRGVELAPSEARWFVRRYVNLVRVVSLSGRDYLDLMDEAVERQLTSGMIYDMIHAHAARKGGARQIATINVAHFERVWAPSRIVNPLDA